MFAVHRSHCWKVTAGGWAGARRDEGGVRRGQRKQMTEAA